MQHFFISTALSAVILAIVGQCAGKQQSVYRHPKLVLEFTESRRTIDDREMSEIRADIAAAVSELRPGDRVNPPLVLIADAISAKLDEQLERIRELPAKDGEGLALFENVCRLYRKAYIESVPSLLQLHQLTRDPDEGPLHRAFYDRLSTLVTGWYKRCVRRYDAACKMDSNCKSSMSLSSATN